MNHIRTLAAPTLAAPTLAALAFAATLLLAATPAHAGSNRIARFDVLGKGQVRVTMQGKKATKVEITMPAAKVELRCNKSGFRPAQIRYGFAPLSFGVKRGHARGKGWNSYKEKNATRHVTFAAGPVFAKTSAKRDPLKPLRLKAIAVCAKGGKGGVVTGKLDVEAMCNRIKSGFGKKKNNFATGRQAPFDVVCIGNKPPQKKAAAGRRGTPTRRRRN